MWYDKTDLLVVDDDDVPDVLKDELKPAEKKVEPASVCPNARTPVVNNIVYLRNKGIDRFYHFTDVANLESIRKHGLMSASNLQANSLTSVMNSSELSRKLDRSKGLQGYVRLSFNNNNPMKYRAVQEERVTQVVMLEIKPEVVSRPGVLFFDSNAVRVGAIQSTSPEIVHFDVVTAPSHYAVEEKMRAYYQAEVLVPSPVPPHLILFPGDQAYGRARSRRVRAPVLPPTVDESIAVGPPPLHSKSSQSKVPGSSLVSRINVDLVLPSLAGTTSGVSLPVAETMTTPVDVPVAVPV